MPWGWGTVATSRRLFRAALFSQVARIFTIRVTGDNALGPPSAGAAAEALVGVVVVVAAAGVPAAVDVVVVILFVMLPWALGFVAPF